MVYSFVHSLCFTCGKGGTFSTFYLLLHKCQRTWVGLLTNLVSFKQIVFYNRSNIVLTWNLQNLIWIHIPNGDLLCYLRLIFNKSLTISDCTEGNFNTHGTSVDIFVCVWLGTLLCRSVSLFPFDIAKMGRIFWKSKRW